LLSIFKKSNDKNRVLISKKNFIKKLSKKKSNNKKYEIFKKSYFYVPNYLIKKLIKKSKIRKRQIIQIYSQIE
jgi:hypothetical protein